jgi:8-oxo-dGTP pyrophosphatase MutT (NUDIX family)
MHASDWVSVFLDDVELPDGERISHHVVSTGKGSQTAVVLNAQRDRVLLIWRHRYVSDTWGWEVPGGWVEPHEDGETAIRREILEETAYDVQALTKGLSYHALPGLSTMRFTSWVAVVSKEIRRPDCNEGDRVGWHFRRGCAPVA